MVDREDQHVVVRATPNKGESEERARDEIKRLTRFVDQEPINFGFKLTRGVGGPIPFLEWRRESGLNDLNRLSIDFLKCGTQCFMPCQNEIEARDQGFSV